MQVIIGAVLTDEETEQEVCLTFPKSHSWAVRETGLNPSTHALSPHPGRFSL